MPKLCKQCFCKYVSEDNQAFGEVNPICCKPEMRNNHILVVRKPDIFQGRRVFVELGHFDSYFVKNTRKIGPAGKNFGFFSPKQSSIYILDEKFNAKMDTMSKIRAIFLIFKKLQGRPPPRSHTPASKLCVCRWKKKRCFSCSTK